MDKYNQPDLDRVFHALADPSRRSIVRMLVQGEQSIGALVPAFSLSFVAVSKHIKVLEQAGFVQRRKQGRQQLCRLDSRGLIAAHTWLAAYESFWSDRLADLDALVAEMQVHPADPAPAPASVSRFKRTTKGDEH